MCTYVYWIAHGHFHRDRRDKIPIFSTSTWLGINNVNVRKLKSGHFFTILSYTTVCEILNIQSLPFLRKEPVTDVTSRFHQYSTEKCNFTVAISFFQIFLSFPSLCCMKMNVFSYSQLSKPVSITYFSRDAFLECDRRDVTDVTK